MCASCLSLLLLIAAPAFAQEGEPPYPLEQGEHVRVTLFSVDRTGDAQGPFYVGSVLAADPDTLSLMVNGGESSIRALAWPDVERVERLGENHTGEALGLLVGGLGGALAGYALADLLSDKSLAGVGGVIFGGLGGLLVGGVVGAHVGNRWEDVPPIRTSSAFRVTVPLR